LETGQLQPGSINKGGFEIDACAANLPGGRKHPNKSMNISTPSKMTEYADRRVWNLRGLEVNLLQIAYCFDIMCNDPGNDVFIQIETSFTLRYPNRTITCDPENIDSIKEAVSILRRPLADLTAFRDGSLIVTFLDGTELHVLKDPNFESWNAQGEGIFGDLALLCSPHEGPPWRE
jgi:hypothetical protein